MTLPTGRELQKPCKCGSKIKAKKVGIGLVGRVGCGGSKKRDSKDAQPQSAVVLGHAGQDTPSLVDEKHGRSRS